MLLVLDNYDSFTYNLVQYAGELGADPVVYRNDALTAEEALALRPEAIVISPGPCTPAEAGISVPLVRAAAGVIPIFGVCLGHQAIGVAFGGRVVRAGRLMHGKTTMVAHSGHPLFDDIPSPLEVMRYHSLVVSPDNCPLSSRLLPGRATASHSRRSWRSVTGPCRSMESNFIQSRLPLCTANDLLANFLSLAGISISAAPPVTV